MPGRPGHDARDALPHEADAADAAGAVVTIGAEPLPLAALVRIARGARVALAPAAWATLAASRAVVDTALRGPDLVYSLNTGLGHMRDQRLPEAELIAYQEAIVAAHAGGLGAPLPRPVVRAAMAARLNGLARGGAGASPAVARALVDLLNAGVHPELPEIGSVGASDLMHMAAIAEVAIGRGWAEYRGERLPGGEALRRAGLAPLALAPKDGLALISANGVSIGRGALVVARAAEMTELADIALAVSLEAIRGNLSIVDPAVAAAKGIPGQRAAADRIRALLAGSDRCRPGAAASVQDALSFRVAPQVHGALREFVAFAAAAVTTELNASDDNPLVSIAEGRLISNGNFHPVVLALSFDALRPALAHVGQICERRMSHLWGAVFADPEILRPAGLQRLVATSHGALLRYAAATRYSQLRALAEPATLDLSPLDLGVEDHATNAPETVRRTDDALDVLEELLAVELLMARSVLLTTAAGATTGGGTTVVLRELTAALDEIPADAPSHELVARLRPQLLGRILPAARAALEGQA